METVFKAYGVEFSSQAEAENFAKVKQAEEDVNRAVNKLAAARVDGLKSADGEPIKLGSYSRDWYYIKDRHGPYPGLGKIPISHLNFLGVNVYDGGPIELRLRLPYDDPKGPFIDLDVRHIYSTITEAKRALVKELMNRRDVFQSDIQQLRDELGNIDMQEIADA